MPRQQTLQHLPMKERDVLALVRDYLRATGWAVWRMQASMGFPQGFSDLLALRQGRVLFLEIKAPGGQLSRHQERFRDEVQAHGGEYVVCRSLEDLYAALKEVRPCPGARD